ncbi:MAG TPA: 16S rRNA (adenine(1518)-N(6)/adenine(1519)-N(6))-dimethyltransferase RsmA [Candidatus Paceibacterota bacterium]|nr:16S rRNA (adenine(1518)-N(6)/adenine(1519)-N(6))-dimethyltransferase RsmA [Candidatus Paceibacterota bacterium]HRY76854.1 16S rRNA (adenine(1518)-N(6)/adenine(1519)-N(6))-dimethyltransferase RsmA [Candidatus Paceibacterota bacterium]
MQFVKKLGQNFLTNETALTKIAAALEIKKGETIIEIGAGSGNLTAEILKSADEVIAIEKDRKWIEELNVKLSVRGRPVLGGKTYSQKLKIVEADVRDVLPQITKNLAHYKIVGNIPYYLTGQLLRIIQELGNPPEVIVLTIQKEVAERIMGKPPKSNQLAAIVSLWAKPNVLFHLKAQDFTPAPKVNSSVIKLQVFPKAQRQKNEAQLIALIKTGFEQPRKTLLNNLSRKFPKEAVLEAFRALNFDEKTRPQELNEEVWIKLAKILPCF